jgi:hypothetical protein
MLDESPDKQNALLYLSRAFSRSTSASASRRLAASSYNSRASDYLLPRLAAVGTRDGSAVVVAVVL